MRFSVLLPTKNRLELLKFAVESVRRQDYADWEIIISDNVSEQDVEGYARSLGDARIRYYRTEKPLPVTDNWNNALSKATGDYVIMLGDDDCLLQGYFRTVRELAESFSMPDSVYSSALLYAYPGVMPAYPDGYLQAQGHAPILRGAKSPFLLPRTTALGYVRDSMNLKLKFGYNMQYFTVRRGFMDSLKEKGDFFQSPFPDFYAANVILLTAANILVYPHPLVTIGISPKSYGFYYSNRLEKQGADFLQNLPDPRSVKRIEKHLMPGTDMNTFWLIAMETVKQNYGKDFRLEVGYRRYRWLQIVHVYRLRFYEGAITPDEFRKLRERMSLPEKIVIDPFLRIALRLLKILPSSARRVIGELLTRLIGQHPVGDPPGKSGKRYENILSVFEDIPAGNAAR